MQQDEFSFAPEEFSGTVRLFPLPNLVLFPHVMQPLHIFEPRYRDMLEEAASDDRLLAMAVLAPGWESDYEGRPPVFPIACLGRVTLHYRLSSGAYNVLLSGLRRVRLVQELPSKKPFREAKAVIQEDHYPAGQDAENAVLHRKLRAAFLRVVDKVSQVLEQLDQLLGSDISLGTLTDIISYMVDIDMEAKIALLNEADVHRRAEHLLHLLAVLADDDEPGRQGTAGFPPQFSAN
jgi:Lon protease-like protein